MTGTFAECPDCGGHRYLLPVPYYNGRGAGLEAWACDGCEGDDAVLCTVDLDLEWNETYEAREDHTGGRALYIVMFDEYEEEEE